MRASAAAWSIAPKTSIRGAGVLDSTSRVMGSAQ
jgi:hypothetical protein